VDLIAPDKVVGTGIDDPVGAFAQGVFTISSCSYGHSMPQTADGRLLAVSCPSNISISAV